MGPRKVAARFYRGAVMAADRRCIGRAGGSSSDDELHFNSITTYSGSQQTAICLNSCCFSLRRLQNDAIALPINLAMRVAATRAVIDTIAVTHV